ncbi:MAG: sugar ABC transporter permease [Acholeplasma sp.]|jgi:multiple sugar transport system permease protein|nr:MAG: sugar ABC transporter permease [Acholeplasma sp.]
MQLSYEVKRRRMKRILKENASAYSFLLPYLVLFSIFFVFPFIYGLIISFFDWNLFFPDQTRFIGFENYRRIWFESDGIYYRYFWTGLGNTLIFVVFSVPFLVLIPLILAALIDMEPRGHKIFRTILFMPTVLSISSVILIWKWQFYTNGGFINALLVKLGFAEIPFLVSQPWAWISIILVTIWWTMGTNMVIFGAGLKNIDKTLYEAASIDGASYLQTFKYITMPSLAPQMLIVMITTVLASFGVYGQPDLLTNGGPEFSTTVLMMRIRPLAFGTNADPGIATAMAVSMGMIMIVVSIIQARIIKKRGDA